MLLTIRQIDFGKQKVIKDYGFSQDGRRYRVQYRVEGANILITYDENSIDCIQLKAKSEGNKG